MSTARYESEARRADAERRPRPWLWWQGRGSPFEIEWRAAAWAALTLRPGAFLCALDLHEWDAPAYSPRKLLRFIPWGRRVLPGRCCRCWLYRSDWIY